MPSCLLFQNTELYNFDLKLISIVSGCTGINWHNKKIIICTAPGVSERDVILKL